MHLLMINISPKASPPRGHAAQALFDRAQELPFTPVKRDDETRALDRLREKAAAALVTRNHEIFRSYQLNPSTSRISWHFKLSAQSVRNILKAQGVVFPDRRRKAK